MDEKLPNDYYGTASVKGSKFYNNDGSFFSFRNYVPNKVMQITKNDKIGLMSFFSDGNIKMRGGESSPERILCSSEGVSELFLGNSTRIYCPTTTQWNRPVFTRNSTDSQHTIEILWFPENLSLVFYVDNQVIATIKQGTNI